MTPGVDAILIAIHHFKRRHADRTTGSVDQFHAGRQQFVQPVAHQRMRLAAAHLHQHQWPGYFSGDPFGDCKGDLRIAIFVDEFHGANPSSARAPISTRYW